MTLPLLELSGVTVTYAGPPPVPALRSCDLVVSSGHYLAVVGPSGSGKSTLLDVLGLLRRPTIGTYLIDGVDTSRLTDVDRTAMRGSYIGFVFQAFHLLPHRSAIENVMLAQLYRRVPAKTRRAMGQRALERVGLAHRMNAPPSQLSGGEKQRVAIARALAMQPRLLLCDEPTGNLDSATAATVLDVIDEVRSGGLTVVMITHSAAVAARADQVVSINDGSISECRSTRRGPELADTPGGAPGDD